MLKSAEYNEKTISQAIKTKWAGKTVYFAEKVDSTKSWIKRLSKEGAEHGTLAVAEFQSAGRGRFDRKWEAPEGSSIMMTILLRPEFEPQYASMLTLVMGLAVAQAVDELGFKVSIKWPNDVVHNGRKMVGILTEMSAEQDYIHHVVIGVGINVREQVFAPEIADKACCIDREWGRKISRSRLLAQIMNAFEEDYEIFMRDGDLSGLQESYNDMLVNRDRIVCILSSRPDKEGRQAEEFRGTALGIDKEGELLVRREDGSVEKVFAGEVSVRGVYGYV